MVVRNEPYYSDHSNVAAMIGEAQQELIKRPGVYVTIEAFMEAFQKLILNPDRQIWRRRAAAAKGLLEEFTSYPPAVQQAVLQPSSSGGGPCEMLPQPKASCTVLR